MGPMEQAVHRGAGEQRVAEEGGELVDGAVRGEDHRAVLVALADDLVEVDGLLAGEGAEAEIVDNEQVRRREAEQAAVVAAVGAGGAELLHEILRRDVEHRVAGAAGAVAQGLGDVRFARPRGPDQQDVFVALDEGAGRQVDDLRLRHRRVEEEVEIFEGAVTLEAGAAQSLVELTLHEAVPGHFLQLAHAARFPSPIRAVFDSDDVLSQLRAVQAMVTHLETFPVERARAACRRAEHFASYGYGALKNILRRGLDLEPLPEATPAPTTTATPRFARPASHWSN